jgi:exodeoxyribonuclease V alpha subunit
MSASKFECDDNDIKKAEGNISYFIGKDITLDDTQKEAIKSAFNNRVTVITGGGGTGKSTICRCIYSLTKEKKMDINMMSPTGKAAKVLSDRTGGAATTIHRGLQITPENMMPSCEITQDILLIDETSMSGIDTMYLLMVAIESNKNANIVFVGDKNQLPSVSPGNFLSDIINSGCVNVVTLDKIHRQDEGSYISLIANEISQGSIKSIPRDASDMLWHNLRAESVDKDITAFVDGYLNDGQSMDDLQFLSPMKKGMCGVHKINEVIQEKMANVNGSIASLLEKDFSKFYLGDRIMQIKNNYEKKVFNGDMGVIVDLGERIKDPTSSDRKEKFIMVDFLGEEKSYYGKEIDELLLAWAITVHKFQGSQSKNVVMFLASEASIMMNKELVYTGFTRAEKFLHIFGHDQMYRLAPTRSSIKKRFTNLNNLIDELQTEEDILQVV